MLTFRRTTLLPSLEQMIKRWRQRILSKSLCQTTQHYILEDEDLNLKTDDQRTRRVRNKLTISVRHWLYSIYKDVFYILGRHKESRVGRTVVRNDNGSVGLFGSNGSCRTAILLRYFHGESASTISLPFFFSFLFSPLSSSHQPLSLTRDKKWRHIKAI